jgi:hypothetical protein
VNRLKVVEEEWYYTMKVTEDFIKKVAIFEQMFAVCFPQQTHR